MRLFDAETEVIKHGGTGWGANMGVLPSAPPGHSRVRVREVHGGDALRNFNLSVAVDDAWMQSALSGADAEAAELLELVRRRGPGPPATPALLFPDRIERDNPVPSLGRLEATNPCGEAPLPPFEACCLGGLNVSRFATTADRDPRRPPAALATPSTGRGFATPPPWRCGSWTTSSRWPLPAPRDRGGDAPHPQDRHRRHGLRRPADRARHPVRLGARRKRSHSGS